MRKPQHNDSATNVLKLSSSQGHQLNVVINVTVALGESKCVLYKCYHKLKLAINLRISYYNIFLTLS